MISSSVASCWAIDRVRYVRTIDMAVAFSDAYPAVASGRGRRSACICMACLRRRGIVTASQGSVHRRRRSNLISSCPRRLRLDPYSLSSSLALAGVEGRRTVWTLACVHCLVPWPHLPPLPPSCSCVREHVLRVSFLLATWLLREQRQMAATVHWTSGGAGVQRGIWISSKVSMFSFISHHQYVMLWNIFPCSEKALLIGGGVLAHRSKCSYYTK
jgi:hypothetical protein